MKPVIIQIPLEMFRIICDQYSKCACGRLATHRKVIATVHHPYVCDEHKGDSSTKFYQRDTILKVQELLDWGADMEKLNEKVNKETR